MRDFWDTKPGALRRLGEQAHWWEMMYLDWLSMLPDCFEYRVYGDPESRWAPERPVLWDVGCGFGQFVRVARNRGWSARGIEPSDYARSRTVADGLVFGGTWEDFYLAGADVISAAWLMEHLERPGAFLDWAHAALASVGILLAVIPNEHTVLQRLANAMVAKKGWWIDPAHLNYWSQETFHALLAEHGFEVIDELGTYPMEEFIIAGMDYTNDPEVGKAAHKKVEDMEMAMTREERLRIGRARASRGEGRDLVVFARKR